MHEVGQYEEEILCSEMFSQPHLIVAFLYLDLVNDWELWLQWNFHQIATGIFGMCLNRNEMEFGRRGRPYSFTA